MVPTPDGKTNGTALTLTPGLTSGSLHLSSSQSWEPHGMVNYLTYSSITLTCIQYQGYLLDWKFLSRISYQSTKNKIQESHQVRIKFFSNFWYSVIFCEAVAIYGVIIAIILYSKVQQLLNTSDSTSNWGFMPPNISSQVYSEVSTRSLIHLNVIACLLLLLHIRCWNVSWSI